MDRHIARTIVRNSAGDARVIWSIFSGYHPQELRESGALRGTGYKDDSLAVLPSWSLLIRCSMKKFAGSTVKSFMS